MGKKYFWLVLSLILIIGLIVFNIFRAPYFLKKNKAGFLCPLPKKYCSRGKTISYKDYYLGVGWKVPAGTPISAVFSGQTKGGRVSYSEEIGGGRFPTILLIGDDGVYEVTYVLTGNDYQGINDIEKGEKIETVRDSSVADLNVNLLVTIYKKENGQKTPLYLKISDFSNK